jgi:Peptidase U49
VTCKLVFEQFEPAIRKCFSRAIDDAGDRARDIQLEIHVDALRPGHKAEFAALPEDRVVRVTWNSIATLWSCCQGFARIAKAMHEGVRNGRERLEVTPNSDLKIGLDLVTASMWFNTNDLPSDGKLHWINGLPPPSALPNDQNNINGHHLFLGALAWILRHEIAHITLGHVFAIASDSIIQEKQADDQAADWLRGDRIADESRPAGVLPTGQELELEQLAVAIVLGTAWIASFEIRARQPSAVHPPIADRIFNTLERMRLREDSAALEIAANCISALIDPQGQWSTPDKPFQNSLEFLQDAVCRLQRYMLDLKYEEPWHLPSADSGHKPGV